MFSLNTRSSWIIGLATMILTGCGSTRLLTNALEESASNSIKAEQAKAAEPVRAVSVSSGSFLLGQAIDVVPTQSPLLTQFVTYRPAQKVSVQEVAAWIRAEFGITVDTAELQMTSRNSGAKNTESKPGIAPAKTGSDDTGPQTWSIAYQGPLAGLLDFLSNKINGWWKLEDGKLVFYQTESKTFYLPSINHSSSGKMTISTISKGTGKETDAGAGENSLSEYKVDVWKDLLAEVKVIAGTENIVPNPSMGSITVSGTPSQINNVAKWVKIQTEKLSQQVAITVQIYKVKVTKEDTYNWNPSIVYRSSSFGGDLTAAQSPGTLGNLSPMSLVGKVLDSATGNAAKYTGSQLAVKALSTLGTVTETMHQTVVTLHGQPVPMQVANQLTFLESTTPGTPTAIGAAPVPPTLTPGTVTTGFTAMFLPQIHLGKVFLNMHITNSTLNDMGKAESGGAMIQTPEVDVSKFPQSVMLTSGDSLLLTAIQLDKGNSKKSGVGSENNYLFGGGVTNSTGKQIIAIVITARVF